MNKKVVDSDDVVIQERGFSIFGTHEPAIAMPLFSFCKIRLETTSPHPHENQIFLVGLHQEVRRFVLSGLHHITSVGSGMSRNERHMLTCLGSFRPSLATIIVHQQRLRTVIYWDRYPRAARRGKDDTGVPWRDLSGARLLAELFETLLVIDAACEFVHTTKSIWSMKIWCWDGRGERLLKKRIA